MYTYHTMILTFSSLSFMLAVMSLVKKRVITGSSATTKKRDMLLLVAVNPPFPPAEVMVFARQVQVLSRYVIFAFDAGCEHLHIHSFF